METYFNIRYEFDKAQVHTQIDTRLRLPGSDYICVADGNITANVHNSEEYREIVNYGMFSISDGSWTPILIKLIYGIKRDSYSGSQLFHDIVKSKKYSIAFLGGSKEALDGLKTYVSSMEYPMDKTLFMELPFCKPTEFDFKGIAEELKDRFDIIFVGLGAPKQEIFMRNLKKFLKHGIMIGVGAVFNFYGGSNVSRAPKWMRNLHLEFLHRLFSEPKKQMPKFTNYLKTIPKIVFQEVKLKNKYI